MTTIVTKNGSGAPLASDLVQGELAVDLTNKRLYTEDSGGTVIEVGTNPSTIDINAGTIDGTVIGGSSAAAGTFTTFTSTGIDDNATSTAITIDSSQRVGVGVTPKSWLTSVNVIDVGTSAAAYYSGGVTHNAYFDNTNSRWEYKGTGAATFYNIQGGEHIWSYAASGTADNPITFNEAMRIDASGNLLVGQTSGSSADAGHIFNPIGVAFHVRDGGVALVVDRLTSDGDITTFRKDGTTVGSIASVGGTGLRINSQGSTGILQNGGSDKYTWSDSTFASANDNYRDLGSASYRFKDLYLSGKLTNNGTGGINIDTSGNVGIGTTSPTHSLDVNGEIALTNASAQKLYWSVSGSYLNWIESGGGAGTTYMRFATGNAEAMRIDASGNVGIGTTSPNKRLEISNGSNISYTVDVTAGNYVGLSAYDYLNSTYEILGTNGSLLTFNTGSGASVTEAMRIDSSGNLLVGTTALNTGQIASTISVTGGQIKQQYRSFGTGNITVVEFVRDTGGTPTTPGSITCTSTATAYNTSSDVRLKENIVDAPAGNIDAIRVRSFDWKADGTHQTYGMVAQELVDVAPEAVSKGETEDDMWGVDYSKLVPMMIKEIQELKAEVAALKGA